MYDNRVAGEHVILMRVDDEVGGATRGAGGAPLPARPAPAPHNPWEEARGIAMQPGNRAPNPFIALPLPLPRNEADQNPVVGEAQNHARRLPLPACCERHWYIGCEPWQRRLYKIAMFTGGACMTLGMSYYVYSQQDQYRIENSTFT